MKKNMPALILGIFLVLLWQFIAMGIDAAYKLPSPLQIIVKLWQLKEILLLVHLPATMGVTFLGLLISVVLGVFLCVIMAVSVIKI